MVSGPSYIISHKRGNPDQIKFYFINEDGSWLTKDAPSLPDNATIENSSWTPSSSFAFVAAGENNEHIFYWDDNYNFSIYNTGISIPTQSFVNVLGNNLIGILTPGSNPKGYYFDFNGVSWNFGGSVDYNGITSPWGRSLQSYGQDFIIGPASESSIRIIKYESNSIPGWSTSTVSTANKNLFYAGYNYFVAVSDFSQYAKMYFRKPDGSFSADPVLISGLQREDGNAIGNNEGRYAWHGGLNYIIKTRNTSLANTGDLLFTKFKNGNIQSSQVLSFGEDPVLFELDYFDPTPIMATPNTFVTFLSQGISGADKAFQKNAKSLRVNRVVNNEAYGNLIDFPVKKISQMHGDGRIVSNYFNFNEQTATYDATGTICQYNNVIVYPGVSTASTVYGSMEYNFFNGILASVAGNFPNSSVLFDNYNNFVKGYLYQSVYKDNQGNIVSSQRSAPAIFEKIVKGTRRNDSGSLDSVNVAKAHYIRDQSATQTIDLITSTRSTQINERNGLPSSVTITSPGILKVTEFQYLFQKYNDTQSKNVLTPLIQTKLSINGQVVAIEATKFKKWGINNNFSGWKSYQWLRSGTPEFTAWQEGATPGVDWKLNSTADLIDETGQVVQTTNGRGITSSVIWDVSAPRILAQGTNVSTSQFFYEGFENFDSQNTSVVSSDFKTGLISYRGSFMVVVPSSGSYLLSYWKKPDGGNWQFIKQTVSVNTLIGDNNTLIDEIRLHPVSADVITYAYDKMGNTITKCDANGLPVYWVYDEFNRLKLILDKDRNIVEQKSYKLN